MKYWQAVNSALTEEMERDDRVIIFGEDVAKAGGVFGASRGLRDRFGASRVRDTPISESAIVSMAVGAAMTGLRPIVEIMFFDFMTLTLDALANQAAKTRYMSGGALGVPLVVRTMYGAGRGAGPQHSQSFEAWLAHVPGLQVLCPSTPADAKGMLKAAIRCDDPVVVIESSPLWSHRGEVPDGDHIVSLGAAKVSRSGTDLTMVSWGWAMMRCLAAADQLASEGIEAEVIDLRSISPLDEEAILRSLSKTGRLLVVHDATESFGVGAEVAAVAAERGFSELKAAVRRLAPPHAPVPFPSHLEEAYYPQPPAIAAAARRLVEESS